MEKCIFMNEIKFQQFAVGYKTLSVTSIIYCEYRKQVITCVGFC